MAFQKLVSCLLTTIFRHLFALPLDVHLFQRLEGFTATDLVETDGADITMSSTVNNGRYSLIRFLSLFAFVLVHLNRQFRLVFS